MPKIDEGINSGQSTRQNDSNKKKRIIVAASLVSVSILSVLGWQWFGQLNNHALHVSGRIEGYEVNIGAKIGGRVDFIAVREGDEVKPGELIVKISDDDIQAQLRGALARLRKAEEQKAQSLFQVEVVKKQVEESKLNKQQAKEETQGRVEQAEADVETANAQFAEAKAQLEEATNEFNLAKIRKDRYGKLLAKGAVTQDQYDQANTNYDTTLSTITARQAGLEAAQRQVAAKEGLLVQAHTTKLNPPIRNAQLGASKRQLELTYATVAAAAQEVQNAQAEVDQIKANIAYLNILSPIDGITTARAVEPGAVVVPGQTVLSLINLETVYLRAYVPEGQIGKVRVGQKAKLYLDSAPNNAIEATVIEIDPVASFTPENIYFRDDRVKQVFGIKISITHPARFCKPGMPADADIVL